MTDFEAETMCPQAEYRRAFRERILRAAPGSVLDVGCGAGELVRFLNGNGIAAQGVEADAALARAARAGGLEVHPGTAEALPFADGAFDLVVSEFSAHHFACLEAYMAEAARVGRRGVVILDPWYDESIPSQRTALRLDRWFKEIDRANGMIHNDVISAGRFVDALPGSADWVVAVEKLLRLAPVTLAALEEWGRAHLEGAPDKRRFAAAFADIRRQAEQDGLSEDGAVIFTALKRGAAGPAS